MKEELNRIRETALSEIAGAKSKAELENVRIKYLGKKGELTAILRSMGSLSPEERPAMGQLANVVRTALEESISFATFPEYVEAYTVENSCTYAVSFNGKTRFTVELPKDMSREAVEAEIRANSLTAKYVGDKTIAKMIVVPGKIVNVVIK